MKRLTFCLVALIAVAANAVAAYSLTATNVNVQDLTVDKDNFFVVVNAATSTGEYEVAFDVWPGKHSLIGEFSATAKTITYISSYVHKTKANGNPVDMWYYPQEDAVITLSISKKDEETCTLSGSIQATRNDVTYTYNIADFDFPYSESGSIDPEPEKDPYRFEPTTPTTVNFIGDVVNFRQKTGFINITLNEIKNETYDWIELNLISEELAWPAGDYTISSTRDENTLTASRGYLGSQEDDPCYVAIRGGDWGQYTPYYLVSGTINVSYNKKTDSIFVTGQATSYNGSTINIDVAGLNMLYNPDDTPREPEYVSLNIDSVVVTFMRELSDHEKKEYPYTLNFFCSTADFPNVIMDVVLTDSMELVAGTYTLAADELSGIALFQNQSDFNSFIYGGQPYIFETVSLTLSDAGDGKWTYSVFITDDIGSEYSFTLTQAPHIINYPEEDIDPEDKPYKDEQKVQSSITAVFDIIDWKDASVSKDGILDIYLYQQNADGEGLRAMMQLGMYTPVSEVPEGTYPVNGTEDEYTFSASLGRFGDVLIPCYLILVDDEGWAHAIWYIVEGAITVGYDANNNVMLSGDCSTYFGSTIHFTYAAPATDIQSAAQLENTAASKVLRNGCIYILRDGKLYDLTGRKAE